jgi:predicted homoserine dehydrogenase-like protein
MLGRSGQGQKDIRVVVVGIGSMGRGIAYQAEITPFIHCVAIADRSIEKAIACAEWLERPYEVVHSQSQLHAAVEAGNLALTDDGNLAAQCELADALIESSTAVFEGALHAMTALNHGLHVIMINAEADLTYGPLLLSIARREGLLYSSCDGDQPAAIKRLVDQILFWRFELVMAGNIKGYLDRYVDPTTIIPEADKRSLDYKMCTSFTDGTKLNIEMALVANALNLRTAVPGMIGPRVSSLSQVFELFDFESLRSVDRQPLVDYVLGAEPKGGVFVIAYSDREYQQFTLDWFPVELGPGPYYLFYRPYHLRHIEAMNTVVDVVLNRRALLKPDYGYTTNVIAYARQDLKSGTKLDGIGGYYCYGLIENTAKETTVPPGLPICLSENVIVRREVSKNERIALSDVIYDSRDARYLLYTEAVTASRKSIG